MATDLNICAHDTILSTNPTTELQKLKDMGAKGVRIGAIWELCEAQKGKFTGYGGATFNGYPQGFEAVDRAVDAAIALGLKVNLLLNIPFPTWANQDSYADWGNFCKQAALRYGPKGVTQFELGNEWNVGNVWNMGGWFGYGAGYVVSQIAAFQKSGSTGVKSVLPQATIVSCGMAAVVDWPNAYWSRGPAQRSPSGMIADMLAQGVGPYIDKVGYHPYTLANDFTTFQPPSQNHPMFVEILNIHHQLDLNGYGSMLIEATEWGYSSADFSESICAAYLQQEWDILHGPAYAPYLSGHYVYSGQNFVYPGGTYSATDREANYGQLRIDGTPKPSVPVISSW